MRETFDLDRQWCLVTIAVSPLYRHSSDFPAAYERIADRIKHTPKEPQ